MAAVTRVEALLVDSRTSRDWLFVAVHSGDGHVGYGEASDSFDDARTIRHLLSVLAPMVLGAEPDPPAFRTAAAASDLAEAVAASGLEQALWALAALQQGRALSDLLGGTGRTRVPVYANVNRGVAVKSPENFAAAASHAAAAGHSHVKLAPFGEIVSGLDADAVRERLAAGVSRVDAVAAAMGGHDRVLVDCHGRFGAATVEDLIASLGDRALHWLEEPVPWPRDRDVLKRVHDAGPFPIAGGELITSLGEHERLIADRCVDTVMVDTKYCGGVAACLDVIAACDAAGVPASIHHPAGPVETLIDLQIAACRPRMALLELPHSAERTELVRRITPDIGPVEGGRLSVPEGPGIGRVDRAGLEGLIRSAESVSAG